MFEIYEESDPIEIGNQRLLNVARALRESNKPEKFTMHLYGYSDCGTPACALGHYAVRTDLQDIFQLVRSNNVGSLLTIIKTGLIHHDNGIDEDNIVRSHFAISYSDGCRLFSFYGCNRAKTPIEAATFIENFVKSRREKNNV